MPSEVQNKYEHAYSVLSMLKNLKDKNLTCDFAIKIGDESLRVHRAVMLACSDFFVQKIVSSVPEDTREYIEVEDVGLYAMERSINFMYTGEAFVTMETVEETLHAAVTLQLHGLTIICVRFLQSSLSIGNCLQVKTIALDFNLLTMAGVAQQYALENFQLVINTEGFKHVSLSVVMKFIESASQCKMQWQATLSWVKRDVDERSQYLLTMLQMIISSGGCSFDFLFCSVWKECLVRDSSECEGLVVKALFNNMDESVFNIDNCFELLRISKKYKNQNSQSMLLKFMGFNFETVCQQHDFKLLDEKEAMDIFLSAEVKLKPTRTKWEAATMWVSSGFKTRKNHFHVILKNIGLQEGGFDFLFNVVRVHPMIARPCCHLCSSIVALAMFDVMETADITESNWYELLQLARKWSTETVERILDFIAANFDDVRQHERFPKLTGPEIIRVLSTPCVVQSIDESKWRAVSKWVKGDSMNRLETLKELIPYIDLSRWRFEFLYGILNNDSLVKQCSDSKELVLSAIVSSLQRSDIKFDNWFPLLVLIKARKKTNAHAMVRDYMRRNFASVSKESNFVKLAKQDLLDLLNGYTNDKSNFDETIAWRAVIEWKRHNEAADFIDILKVLQLRKCSFKFLHATVYKEPSVTSCDECKELIIVAIFSVFDYQNITVENWFELLCLAKENEHLCPPVTIKKIYDYIARNLILISRQANFVFLDKSEILAILQSKSDVHNLPQTKWTAVTAWMEKREQQNNEFAELLKSLNLYSFSFVLLLKCVLKEQLVMNSQVCTEIVVDALLHVVKLTDITPDNYGEVMEIARRYENNGSNHAVTCVRNFMVGRFETVYRQQAFLQMNEEDITYIFSSLNFGVSPTVKANAALNWVKANEAERSKMLPRLFAFIRLRDLSIASLQDLHKDNVIKQSQECKDMITDAVFASNNPKNSWSDWPKL